MLEGSTVQFSLVNNGGELITDVTMTLKDLEGKDYSCNTVTNWNDNEQKIFSCDVGTEEPSRGQFTIEYSTELSSFTKHSSGMFIFT